MWNTIFFKNSVAENDDTKRNEQNITILSILFLQLQFFLYELVKGTILGEKSTLFINSQAGEDT